jgi:hypothetical protein
MLPELPSEFGLIVMIALEQLTGLPWIDLDKFQDMDSEELKEVKQCALVLCQRLDDILG